MIEEFNHQVGQLQQGYTSLDATSKSPEIQYAKEGLVPEVHG